jgi:aryl-alcohol dehydrogenase-like predicted oxidoreductase
MLSKLTLNNSDLSVSQLCYGTNMLGTAIDQGRANAILDRFAELGGNFIDTARSYGDWIPDVPAGPSERAIGAWLKRRNRADFVIATKGGLFDMRAGDWRNRCTPEDRQHRPLLAPRGQSGGAGAADHRCAAGASDGRPHPLFRRIELGSEPRP